MFRLLFTALLCGLLAPAACAADPADASATTAARRLLDYLAALPDHSGRRVLSGQFTAFPRWIDYEYPLVIDKLIRDTGYAPAILGADYGATVRDPADDDLAPVNRRLLDWHRSNGVVALSWHARNPWTGGSSWDVTRRDFEQLLTPGTPAHKRWRRDLDRVATALAELQEQGIPILWRPFHEMNGRWFWWGGVAREEYLALWRDMFRYFTEVKKLHHLLWVYSASSAAHKRTPADAYYPGNEYVDIVGLDNYSDDIVWDGYAALTALPKPFAATEFGPDKSARSFDYARLLPAIRERYPRTVYVLCWGTKWALVNNRNAATLLEDEWIVRRDHLAGQKPARSGK